MPIPFPNNVANATLQLINVRNINNIPETENIIIIKFRSLFIVLNPFVKLNYY